MKRADEVLAVARVDSRLAAHARVNLSQQRRWDLHQSNAAAQACRAKSGEIADHSAAERDDNVSPLDPSLDQRIDDAGELGIGLRPLPWRADDRGETQTRPIQAGGESIEIERRD